MSKEDPATRMCRRWALLAGLTLALVMAVAATALVQRNQGRAQLERGQLGAMQLLVMLDEDLDEDRQDGAGDGLAGEGSGRGEQARRRAEVLALSAELAAGWRGEQLARMEQLSAALRRAVYEEREGGARGGGGDYGEVLALARPLEKSDEPVVWQALERAYRLAGGAALRRGANEEARGLLDRAALLGGRLYVERPAAPVALVLAASHALLARLESQLGAAERSEQQWRFALELYEKWRLDDVAGTRLLRALALALAELGDLEVGRQRRAGARGFYDRAAAMATSLREVDAAAGRRLLAQLGLRRMERGLGGAELCLPLLQLLAPELVSSEGAAGWRRTRGELDRWLAACPRSDAADHEAARRWAEALRVGPEERPGADREPLSLARVLALAAKSRCGEPVEPR